VNWHCRSTSLWNCLSKCVSIVPRDLSGVTPWFGRIGLTQ
jgi:hypothetical protein